jgi:hypothetical protein
MIGCSNKANVLFDKEAFSLGENQTTFNTFEDRLIAIERGIESVVRNISTASTRARKAKRAAQTGSIRDITSAVEELSILISSTYDVIDEIKEQCDVDVTEFMNSGAYQKEFLELAEEEGVRMIESDGRILCYPTIIQLSPSDGSVLLDKKKERGVRPSFLVKKLKDLSQRQVRFRPEAFIEALAFAYDLVIAEKKRRVGSVVKLQEVHKVLTILPASRSYSKSEFARDIYLLDQSGVIKIKDGRTLTLPASALTRSSGTLETVAKGGQVKLYAGIAFEGSQ